MILKMPCPYCGKSELVNSDDEVSSKSRSARNDERVRLRQIRDESVLALASVGWANSKIATVSNLTERRVSSILNTC